MYAIKIFFGRMKPFAWSERLIGVNEISVTFLSERR